MSIDTNTQQGRWDGLMEHVGHEIACTTFGTDSETYNVALVCDTCEVVLLDQDNPHATDPQESAERYL